MSLDDSRNVSDTKLATSRRTYLKTAGAGLVGSSAALLAGCAGQGSGGGGGGSGTKTGQSSQKTVNITFWHTEPEKERASTIAAQVKKFEEQSESPVKVSIKPVDETKIGPQALASAQASVLPNVIMSPTRFTHLMGVNDLLDSKAIGEVIDRIGKDRFRKGPLQMSSAGDGSYYAVPHDCFITAFYWRKSKFEEMGLKAPDTWDSLLSSAEALHKPDQDQYGISIGDGKNNVANQHFQHIALSHNAHLFNDNGEVTFNTPEMIDALKLHGKLGNLSPPGYQDSEGARDTYLDELTYNVCWATYITDDILLQELGGGGEEMLDDSHLVTLLEDGNGNKGTFGLSQGFNILNSNNKGITDAEVKASQDFIEFLFTPEAYIPWLHLAPAGYRPTISGITDKEEYQKNEVLQAWDQKWQKAVGSAIDSEYFAQFGFSGGNAFPKVGNITGQYLTSEAVKKVVDGGDPAAVAKEYQSKMEEAASA